MAPVISSSSARIHSKALWTPLIACAILLLGLLAIACSADENTTQDRDMAETVACDRYAATDGSDAAKGNKAAPFGTVQRLIDSLSAGQVGCLRGGVYADPDKQVVF